MDTVVWSAAYEQAVGNGADEKQAVREADSAVRLTQSSMTPEDVSRFEGGSPFVRVFTQFYSYFNMQANLLGTHAEVITREMGLKKGAKELLYLYIFGFMAPAVLGELIMQAMSGPGKPEDEDAYLANFLDTFFGSQFRSATAMVPIAGQASLAAYKSLNDKAYDDRLSISPAVSVIESTLVGNPKNLVKILSGEEVSSKKVAKDLLTLLGLMSGLPLAPLAKPIGYLSDVSEGKAEPTGPVDFTRGVLTGKSGK
jgi:hypothetical protein